VKKSAKDQYCWDEGMPAINQIIVQLGHWEIKIFENNLREIQDAAILLKYLRTFKSICQMYVKQADIKDQRQGLHSKTNLSIIWLRIRPQVSIQNENFGQLNQEICDKMRSEDNSVSFKPPLIYLPK